MNYQLRHVPRHLDCLFFQIASMQSQIILFAHSSLCLFVCLLILHISPEDQFPLIRIVRYNWRTCPQKKLDRFVKTFACSLVVKRSILVNACQKYKHQMFVETGCLNNQSLSIQHYKMHQLTLYVSRAVVVVKLFICLLFRWLPFESRCHRYKFHV